MGKAFESIRQGLKEAAAHARGEAAVRARLGLTQDQFAARFGFSVATLRHWERGDRRPQGAALVLLNLIEREPQAVMRALS